jgi:hypothetical protein
MPPPRRSRAKRRRKAAKAAKAVKAADASTPAASLTLPPLPLPESDADAADDADDGAVVETGDPFAAVPPATVPADGAKLKRYHRVARKKRHAVRNRQIGRVLAYIGVALAVGWIVFYVINSLETRDRTPPAVIFAP